MPDEPERNYFVEAKMILMDPTLRLVITRAHLEAMEESRQAAIIRCANITEQAMRDMLGLP